MVARVSLGICSGWLLKYFEWLLGVAMDFLSFSVKKKKSVQNEQKSLFDLHLVSLLSERKVHYYRNLTCDCSSL